MQQKTEPARIGPRCGHADRGVNAPIGKNETRRGGRFGSSRTILPALAVIFPFRSCNSLLEWYPRIRDKFPRSRARDTSCWIPRNLSLTPGNSLML